MAGMAQVRLCLPYGFDTRHSKPWVGANVEQVVIAGLDPAIHLLRKKLLAKMDGCPDQVRA
jgi:hypothetical protein